MITHLIPPLCAAVLCSALAAPALAQTQTPSAGSSAAAPAAPKARATGAPKAAAAPRVTMDLKAPPLSHIYPREQLQYLLAVDNSEGTEQEVSVQGDKYVVPVPRGQFLAIPWALMHPGQAWRIFTPVEAP